MTPSATILALRSSEAQVVPPGSGREARPAGWFGEPTPLLLLCLIAQRLVARIELLPGGAKIRLRAVLCDYVRGVPPGTEKSFLQGAAELELELIRTLLTRQLNEAFEEVAKAAAYNSAEDLVEEIAESIRH
jgi:hypothetical protein